MWQMQKGGLEESIYEMTPEFWHEAVINIIIIIRKKVESFYKLSKVLEANNL